MQREIRLTFYTKLSPQQHTPIIILLASLHLDLQLYCEDGAVSFNLMLQFHSIASSPNSVFGKVHVIIPMSYTKRMCLF